MSTHFVLIDFENVQPDDLGLLREGPFQVRLFLGPHQVRIPIAIASELQSLGDRAEYVAMESAGNNALDFHIAYYLGILSSEHPSATFHIISRDAGFDPLIAHLHRRKISVQRSTCIADLPCFKAALAPALESRLNAVVADLRRRKGSVPRTQKTLLGTMRALFGNALPEEDMAELFSLLRSRGLVKVEGTRISYDLPDAP